MDIFTITIGISILVYIVIGSYAGRGVKKLEDYFVAGRRAPTLLILGTLVASYMSTALFMGEAGFTYSTQLGAYMLFPGIAVTGYLLGALFFGVFIRRSKAPTVADYFGQRFQSRRIQQFAGFTIIFGLGCYLVVVTQGLSLLLASLTGLSPVTSLIVAWLSYTLFTMYSGSRGVILTDTVMFLFFIFATILFAGYIFEDLGGFRSAITSLVEMDSKQGLASWTGIIGEGTGWPTALDFVIWVVVIDIAWATAIATGPWQASRHLMAKNEHVVLRAAILACLFAIGLQMLVYVLGGMINLYNPEISPEETVLIWAAQNVVPEMLGALLLAGIIAAGLSSASTFLSLVGFSISNDIGRKPISLDVNINRIVMLVTSVVALIACYLFPPDIFWFMLYIGTLFASSWGPMALMSVWSKRITKDAAFWGIITGFFMNLGPAFINHIGIVDIPEHYCAVIGVVSSFIVIIIVSAMGKVTQEEKNYRMRLHQTPASEISLSNVKKTMLAPIGILLYGLLMPYFMLYVYVIPYQVGTGEILPDGSLNWSTPEAIVVFTATALHVPLALMAIRVIRNRYHPDSQRNRNSDRNSGSAVSQ